VLLFLRSGIDFLSCSCRGRHSMNVRDDTAIGY
jgi:hypothetical protein